MYNIKKEHFVSIKNSFITQIISDVTALIDAMPNIELLRDVNFLTTISMLEFMVDRVLTDDEFIKIQDYVKNKFDSPYLTVSNLSAELLADDINSYIIFIDGAMVENEHVKYEIIYK